MLGKPPEPGPTSMTAFHTESGLSVAEIQDQRDRILASKIFSRSKRQSAFLDHVVNAELAGRADKLKEIALGIDVFEKDTSFNPGTDPIVRVEAARVRAKLREYYDEDGSADPIRIEIPKGHYVPLFSATNAHNEVQAAATLRRLTNRKSVVLLLAVSGIALLLLALVRYVPENNLVGSRIELPAAALEQIPRTERSIAVLPFRNRSALADDVYFVDGIHDDILTQLSKLSSLNKVISRTSMEQYRDSTKSIREIGAELGVVTVLEGSVQRAGDRVRITVQLINAVHDKHLWSETYDRELTTLNIFAIQSDIALSVSKALYTTLSQEDQKALNSIPTRNLQAYELYQQARQIRRTQGLGSQEDIPRLLQEATTLDPSFVLAYVDLARAYSDRFFTLERDPAHLELARNAVDKAFALSPSMPEVRIALADYYYKGSLDYARALEQLNFAIPQARSNSEAYAIRAFILRRRGDIEAAIPDLVRAIELDPGNFSPRYVLADTYAILGRYEQAIDLYNQSMELAPENFGLRILKAYAQLSLDVSSSEFTNFSRESSFAAYSGPATIRFRWEIAMFERDYELAMVTIDSSESEIVNMQFAFFPLDLMRGLTEFYLGEKSTATELFKSASSTLQRSMREIPDDPRIFSARSFALAGLGNREEAIEAASKAVDLYPVSSDAVDGPLYVLNFARTYAMLGERAAAIEKLSDLLARPSNWYVSPNVILRDPAFEELKEEPDFVQLIELYIDEY